MADNSDPAPGDLAAYARAWADAWEQASDDEKDWRASAEEAGKAYAGDPKSSATAFNIFHSNVETLVPSLYNSTPQPDVRRRFQDDDHVAKEVGDLIERALSFSVDAYDYDDVLDRAVRDMVIRDRGLARIKYNPVLKGEGESEKKIYEEVTCTHVSWASFRRGPAKLWADVPWIGFEHFIDRKELERLKGLGGGNVELKSVSYSYSADAKTIEHAETLDTPRFGKRARALEIWDKDAREVIWILPGQGNAQCLCKIADPLELEGFYPVPRPMMQIVQTDSLIPVTGYSIYKTLIDELGTVTERINKLVKELRPRGGYAGIGADVKLIQNAGDGELVPLGGAEMFASQGGGVDKAITWYPLEPIILGLKQLVEHRNEIKETIYEVTGLSDILRGSTDAGETATAQQIKTQWGSVRIQRMQAEVQRFARDIFRMKAELMCAVFDMKTFGMITGLQFPTQQDQQAAQMQLQQMQSQAQMQAQQPGPDGQPPQPAPPPEPPPELTEVLRKPSAEQIEQLLRDDVTRGYRIDIESDSTIRGDLTRNQESMKGFLEGTGAYAAAMGPLIQEGAMPAQVAIEIYGAFARSFKLGKQAEDAIDKWADESRQQKEQGGPQAAAAQAAQAEMELKGREVGVKEAAQQKDGEEKDRRFELDATKAKHEMILANDAHDREGESANAEAAHREREFGLAERGQAHTEDASMRDHDMAMRGQAHTEDTAMRDGHLKERAQSHTEMAHGDGHGLAREQFEDAQDARREEDATVRAMKGLPEPKAPPRVRELEQEKERKAREDKAAQNLEKQFDDIRKIVVDLHRMQTAPRRLIKPSGGGRATAIEMNGQTRPIHRNADGSVSIG